VKTDPENITASRAIGWRHSSKDIYKRVFFKEVFLKMDSSKGNQAGKSLLSDHGSRITISS